MGVGRWAEVTAACWDPERLFFAGFRCLNLHETFRSSDADVSIVDTSARKWLRGYTRATVIDGCFKELEIDILDFAGHSRYITHHLSQPTSLTLTALEIS